ncbi:hypothetical protein BB561_001907 [Smittium simulii]|uniref:Reverse transcriptase zinc-binding domain-containing protein n=1 Tax=Smittium simulii TaxID=133385 RepID=A0A2T9YSN1_9FUNG|nr:hypothetical protein BB561_001907 [Smittium simulii]
MFLIPPYIEDKINRAGIIDENDYYFPIKRLAIAGKPIDDFNPKSARQYILDNLNKINVNINDWNISDNKKKIKIPTWQEISNTKIIPKIKSLIWAIYHNATYNEKKFNIFNNENSTKCKYCTETDEDIEHTFFSCNRIRLFWNKINEFLNKISLANNPPNTITNKDVIERLNKFKGQLPNIEVIHALALWEIHRAKTEYNLSNINLTLNIIIKINIPVSNNGQSQRECNIEKKNHESPTK